MSFGAKFITVALEGSDASGKATQSRLLAERLNGTLFSFPRYETVTGQIIKAHLKKQVAMIKLDGEKCSCADAACNDTVFQALMVANRYEALPEIAEALKRGPVIHDRWKSSTTVYGAAKDVDRAWTNLVQNALPEPDFWILLDVPTEEGFKRRPERRDRHETDRPFLEKVRSEYLALFGSMNRVEQGRWSVVDGLGTIEEVHERIMKIVNS